MTGGQTKLDRAEVAAAGLVDWQPILGRLKARFRTADLITGLALVNDIGALASAQDQPIIVLSPADVIVTLRSPGVHGVTGRDVDLARQISRQAAERGILADVAGLTQVELGLDTGAGAILAPMYAALLGAEVQHGEVTDSSGGVPTLWWQDDEAEDDDPGLPEQSFQQRWHLDVWVADDEAEPRLRAVLAAGGRLVSDAAAPAYWVIEDSDGNRSCICTSRGR